jgi:hypothetical protein
MVCLRVIALLFGVALSTLRNISLPRAIDQCPLVPAWLLLRVV